MALGDEGGNDEDKNSMFSVELTLALPGSSLMFLTVVVGAAPLVPNEFLETCIFHNPTRAPIVP
jgi:hypothetical protein